MSKLTKASDNVIEFIEDIIASETTLERYITWRIFCLDKQKELIKITKASATVEYLAKATDCIVIYVNETLFDMMAPDNVNDIDYRKLIIKDALTMVNIVENENTGKMKIKIDKPQICLSLDGYESMGENLVKAHELVSLMLQQLEEKEKEEKQSKH